VSVDQTTGSVTLRAVFPNPDHTLLPGMFVHAQLQAGVNAGHPGAATRRDPRPQGHPTALVVNQDNKVELRQLKASRTVGSDWLIEEGLNAGDRLITEGLQYVAQASRSRSAKRPTSKNPAPAQAAAPRQGSKHVEIFIDRPIFAWVIALVIMLVGASRSSSCRSTSTRASRRRPSPSP
jgi:membrane fusion protein (multidrug efflux system)